MRATRLSGVMLLLALLTGGCAALQSVFAPSPPASPSAPPPTRKAPAAPPPVLSPEMGRADEDRLKREAGSKIRKAEQTVQQLDQKKLGKEQQDMFSTIQSFLAKAKEALSAQDFLRASNLADKAQVVAEELARTLQ